MTFEAELVETFVIEHAESGCQATKCPDEPELRGDAVYDEAEPDVGRERETSLGLTLHIGQGISGGETIGVQHAVAVSGECETADSGPDVESTTYEL